jgi:hypothetical protein
MILGGTCEGPRYTIVSSAFRYAFEALFRVIAVIEAFAQIMVGQLPGQCVNLDQGVAVIGDCTSGPNINGQAAQPSGFTGGGGTRQITKPLGNMIVALATFVVDATIGIGRLGCTSMCNGGFELTNNVRFKPTRNPCDCYK